MKFIFFYVLSCIALVICNAVAQPCDSRLALTVAGDKVKRVEGAPSGIWLLTGDGNILFAPHIDSLWYNLNLIHLHNESDEIDVLPFDISFFDNGIGIAAGYMHVTSNHPTSELEPRESFALQSMNGKTAWRKIELDSEDVIYDIFISKDKAWMGGLSGKLYYSTNHGASWDVISQPFSQMEHIHSIYIRDDGPGFVSSGRGTLKFTVDGGVTWDEIPTPCQQIATEFRSCESIIVDAIQMFGDYLLVRQGGKCFYSRTFSIKWHAMPAGALHFEVLNSNKLAVVDSNSNVIIYDSLFYNLDVIPNERGFKARATDAYKGILCLVDDVGRISLMDNHLVKVRYPMAADRTVMMEDVNGIEKYNEVLFGFIGSLIYRSQDYGRTWCLWGSAPFEVLRIIATDEERIIAVGKNRPGAIEVLGGAYKLISSLQNLYITGVVTEGKKIVLVGISDSTVGTWPNVRTIGSDVVYYSIDSGFNWDLLFQKQGFYPQDIGFISSTRLIAINDKGNFYQLNIPDSSATAYEVAMQCWVPEYNPEFPGLASDLVFCDSLNWCISSSNDRKPFSARTYDGGGTWHVYTRNPLSFAITLNRYGKTVAATSDKIYVFNGNCSLLQIVDIDDLYLDNEQSRRIEDIAIDNNGDLLVKVVMDEFYYRGGSVVTDMWLYDWNNALIELLN